MQAIRLFWSSFHPYHSGIGIFTVERAPKNKLMANWTWTRRRFKAINLILEVYSVFNVELQHCMIYGEHTAWLGNATLFISMLNDYLSFIVYHVCGTYKIYLFLFNTIKNGLLMHKITKWAFRPVHIILIHKNVHHF